MHLTIRSGVVSGGQLVGGPWKGSEGDLQVAPVAATGSIVYWTTSNNTELKGFHLGDTSVQPVITPLQEGGGSNCIACHTSTPDGLFVGLTTDPDANNGTGNASIDLRSVDGRVTRPSYLTPSAMALLGRLNQHAAAFSRSHWSAGDHTMLSMYNPGGSDAGYTGLTEIIWTDLEAKGQVEGTDW